MLVAWLKRMYQWARWGTSGCSRLFMQWGCDHLGIWCRALEDALILLCGERYAETAGYYDCGCSVAGEL
jgi:hypothetical protein